MMVPDWAAFPAIELHPDRVLYRVHRTSNDPIYFSTRGDGRFDLTTFGDIGTCYAAASPLGAFVETLGRIGTVTETAVEERSLSELALTQTLRVADLTNRVVLGRYGIAGDVSAGQDYAPSQALAAHLYEAGFDGIWYTARHDPAFQERSLAIFGNGASAKLFAQSTGEVPGGLMDDARRQFDIIVLPESLS